ncbi:MAG: CPBP family intramembrane metalloprotease [Nitrospirae bacterium]|nr:CPBP family intramembrane metalloprotease [Nitrospirota bacterium]MCL5238803.1 CPBP family intramembrane metalloprotease [Nitrospirota bacterium]
MSVSKVSIDSRIPLVPWTVRDLAIVAGGTFLSGLLFYALLLVLFGNTRATFRLARYVAPLIMIFFPPFWIKRKYGLSKETLGLRKGNPIYVLIGVTIAVIYSVVIQLTPLKYGTASVDLKSYSLVYLIWAPFSISGFPSIVLAPISEEILDRGFIYSYLRKKLGVGIALMLQALLFSLLHFNYAYSNALSLLLHRFVVGVILGLLYEKSGNLYPSIICHSTINYLAVIIFALNK